MILLLLCVFLICTFLQSGIVWTSRVVTDLSAYQKQLVANNVANTAKSIANHTYWLTNTYNDRRERVNKLHKRYSEIWSAQHINDTSL